MLPNTKAIIRQQCIKQRKMLDPHIQSESAKKLADAISQWSCFVSANCIGLYQHHQSEIDPSILARYASQQGLQTAFPILQDDHRLLYILSHYDGPMRRNCYDILEPAHGVSCQPDLIILPIVAINNAKIRLGYGKGYFDRYLQALREEEKTCVTIGVGYDFQLNNEWSPDPWDQACDHICLIPTA